MLGWEEEESDFKFTTIYYFKILKINQIKYRCYGRIYGDFIDNYDSCLNTYT